MLKKTCKHHGKLKVKDIYVVPKTGTTVCKICKFETSKRWDENNPGRRKYIKSRWYEKNKKRILKACKLYRKKNKDTFSKKDSYYYQKNKERIKAKRKKRYLLMKQEGK